MNKNVLIIYEKTAAEDKGIAEVAGIMEKMGYITLYCDDTSRKSREKALSMTEHDIIISFDFAGFVWGTQTGSFLYHILPCKSIHFFRQKGEDLFAVLGGRKISIALYLYSVCVTEEEEEAMRLIYDNVPWLRGLRAETHEEWERALKEAVEDFV